MDLNLAKEYLLNFIDKNTTNYYNEIINFEKTHYIPAVQIETAVFLSLLANIIQPKNILEIGFGSGVSSIFINKNLKNNDLFISLERDINRVNRGSKLLNFFKIDNIQLKHYNAFDFFKINKLKFDFIFLDAVKREYIDYIDPIKNILNQDGILICDNNLFGGKVYEKNIEKRYINGVNLLKKFQDKLINDESFDTNFLLLGDGISISKKIK